MGRTIPSWRLVLEEEFGKLKKFKDSLRSEDRSIFEDMMNQCKLYASAAGSLTSPVKEFPLVFSVLFAHHKKLSALEAQLEREKHDAQ